MSQSTLLSVTGMTCGSCAKRVDRALRSLDGVIDVFVSVRESTARVSHSPDLSEVELVEALRGAGYDGGPQTVAERTAG